MFRLKGGTLGKRTENTVRDVMIMMSTATPLLDPQRWLAVWIMHWCIFMLELHVSVQTNNGRELANRCCGHNVATLCEKGLCCQFVYSVLKTKTFCLFSVLGIN